MVSRRQLLDAGLSVTVIRDRVRAGRLLVLHRGVYAVGHRQLRREGRWLAAVLAIPGSVLSHRDAAGLHGFRPANHAKVDVTVERRARDQTGIRVHNTRVLDADDVTTVSGIPVTTVARTLVDLAGIVPRDHLAKAIKETDRQQTFDLHAIHDAMARTRGRRGPGATALRKALAEHEALATTLTRSSLEDAFQRLLDRHRLPKAQTNVFIEGREVDVAWPSHKLVVELDGWEHHRQRHAFERDRTRDAALTAAGWRVVRFTHRQVVHRPDHVVDVLRRLGIG